MLNALADRMISIVELLYDLTEMILLSFRHFLSVLRHGTRPVLTVYLRQIYFTGLEAFRIITLTAAIIGTVVIAQIVSVAGAGSGVLVGKVMVWITIRELGPLLTAIIVIARSGAAIAAELSQMKIGGENEYLESMGIPVQRYLVTPRVIGCATALLILVIYFDCAALLGGFGLVSLAGYLSWQQYIQGVFSVLTVSELLLSLIKCILFGLCIGAVCCMQGLKVGKSVTQIPQATTKAVMYSLLFLFALDGSLSLLFLMLPR